MNKKIFIILIITFILLLPLKETCGTANPNYKSCRYPPDKNGESKIYYDIQPLGVSLVEFAFPVRNFPIRYTTGYDSTKIQTSTNYTNTQIGFQITKPDGWVSQELGPDATTEPGIYFSPTSYDFNNPHGEYTDGYVHIWSRPTNEWVTKDENKKRKFLHAKDLIETIAQEEKERRLPRSPGPPIYLGLPKRKLPPETIEVSNVQTAVPGASLYWVIHNDRLFEIFVQLPSAKNGTSMQESEQKISNMLASFRFLE